MRNMYLEEAHRERWKALAKRLWTQRNEAKETILRLIDIVAKGQNQAVSSLAQSWMVRAHDCDATHSDSSATYTAHQAANIRSGTMRQCAEELRAAAAGAELGERRFREDTLRDEQDEALSQLALKWSDDAVKARGFADTTAGFRRGVHDGYHRALLKCRDGLLEALGLSHQEAEIRDAERFPF